QFDLTLEVVASNGSLAGTLEYRSDLFDAATMARIGNQYVRLLEAVATEPGESLSALPLLDEAERKQLLVQWNDTASQYPRDRCLPQLIEDQVARTPQLVAAIIGERQLTYRELNARANRLAHHLRALGVVADERVAVCMPRGI